MLFDLDKEERIKMWGTWGDQFVIEPRAASGGGYSTTCWLVVKDKKTNKYIKDSGGRAYRTFGNSDEIRKYFESLGL